MIDFSTALQNPQSFSVAMLFISFLGGVVASISPCSLAMLPLIIGYVGGYSKNTPKRTFIQLCSFIFGTAIVFTIIGAVCALTGKVFAPIFGVYFTLIIASLLMVMGLKLLGVLDFELPTLVKTLPMNNNNSLFLYPILIGMLFALAGTPCSTPILAGIMAFTAMGKSLLLAILMLFLFSLGQGMILVIAGLFTTGLKQVKAISAYSEIILKISGFLLICVSIFLFWKVFSPLI